MNRDTQRAGGIPPETSARASQAATIWFTGYSGAGKTTLARAVVERLDALDLPARLLDADNLRDGLNDGLGFSPEDRSENVRRLGEVAILFAEVGMTAVVAAISPYRTARQRVRDRHCENGIPFFEIFVSTSLEVCERRDPKGLYARARAGGIERFTGISDAYEPPEHPDLVIATETEPVEAATDRVIALLVEQPITKAEPQPTCEGDGLLPVRGSQGAERAKR